MNTPPEMVLIIEIDPNPFNPRQKINPGSIKELAGSIQRHGFLGVLEGRRVNGKIELAYGARRLAASREAGLTTLPVIIHDDWDDEKMLEVGLIENLQREDLNPVEEANAIAELMQSHGYTQQQVGKVIGKSQGYVAQRLLLPRLALEVQEALARDEITFSHARAFAALPTEYQLATLMAIDGLSSRKATNLIQAVTEPLTDPGWWEIPEDTVLSHTQENLARLIQWHSHQQKEGSTVHWIVSLREQRLLKPLTDLIWIIDRRSWELRNLLGCPAADGWRKFVQEKHPDWTCQTCLFRDYPHLLQEVRSDHARRCQPKEEKTCLAYLGETPTVIRIAHWSLRHVIQEEDDRVCYDEGTDTHYVQDVQTLEELYQAERARTQALRSTAKQDKAVATQETVARYYELLQIAEVEHPLAQLCSRCVHHKTEVSVKKSCEFGREGLEQWDKLQFWSWMRDDGLVVPRCSHFEYKTINAIPEVPVPPEMGPLFRLMAETVLAHWSYTYNHRKRYSAKYLVKSRGGKKMIRTMALPRLATVVYDQIIDQRIEHVQGRSDESEQKEAEAPDPTTGKICGWRKIEFLEMEQTGLTRENG